MNRKDCGKIPAARKFAGDRKPPPKLADDDRKFRRTQPLDRQRPEASPYTQKLENQEEPVETNKPTTSEGAAAGGSRRPKVHRTSGNPPMTTPGTRTSPASSGFVTCLPTQRRERRKVGAEARRGGFWVAHRWPSKVVWRRQRRGPTEVAGEREEWDGGLAATVAPQFSLQGTPKQNMRDPDSSIRGNSSPRTNASTIKYLHDQVTALNGVMESMKQWYKQNDSGNNCWPL
ncbi:hypothetical protein Cgig2_023751 [Carnegiea gigantea]|uniref:Uncharacterized protein n=1 Tax=Carnegiea gigantea TaxID=171969 RepID=A0A9Q1QGH4_9CARY|nr:hypothetical protein Cgig2_023751 [Carnegiea gigantea]